MAKALIEFARLISCSGEELKLVPPFKAEFRELCRVSTGGLMSFECRVKLPACVPSLPQALEEVKDPKGTGIMPEGFRVKCCGDES